jgi:hypothetical protein
MMDGFFSFFFYNKTGNNKRFFGLQEKNKHEDPFFPLYNHYKSSKTERN